MRDLEKERAQGLKRVFGPRYMELRRLTEARLRSLFVEAGGTPEREAPHYFVLGSSQWFRGLHPDPAEVVLPISQLPSNVTSFTYPDSFTAMAYGPRFNLPYVPRPYHERAFRLEELEEVVATFGLPLDEANPNYEGYQNRPFEMYIEVQLWSDQPIQQYLATPKPAVQQAAEADGRTGQHDRSAVSVRVPRGGSPMVSFTSAAA